MPQLGTYNARVVDYGIDLTLGGDPQAFLIFDVEFPGGVEQMRKSLSFKAPEFTIKALLAVGYTGEDGSDLLDGPESGVIKIGAPAKVVIQNHEYNGETTMQISFVNPPPPANLKAAVKAFNLRGEIARLKASRPASAPVDDTPDVF